MPGPTPNTAMVLDMGFPFNTLVTTVEKWGVSPVSRSVIRGLSPFVKEVDLTSVTERPLRADAQRNFDAIVKVALDVFAEQGTQGSLDEIATRAGVANATLYGGSRPARTCSWPRSATGWRN